MAIATLSTAAEIRLRKPRTRGVFRPLDAARRQLGLLSVADSQGQGRIYWLIDLPTSEIIDARFLAFGEPWSHPLYDAFTELARGNTVSGACQLSAEQVDSLLRDDPATPAFGDLEPYVVMREVQSLAEAALPTITLLPKPKDAPKYERKRKADWNDEDARWLPLGLLKKAELVETVLAEVLHEKLDGQAVTYQLVEINDDFRVRISFRGLPEEQVPTLCQFLQDALHGRIHSQMSVEAA
jgi:NifU-like protein involved in Fe-S cluster formation